MDRQETEFYFIFISDGPKVGGRQDGAIQTEGLHG